MNRRSFLKRCGAVLGGVAVAGVVKVEVAANSVVDPLLERERLKAAHQAANPLWVVHPNGGVTYEGQYTGQYGVSPTVRHLEDQRKLNHLYSEYMRQMGKRYVRSRDNVVLEVLARG